MRLLFTSSAGLGHLLPLLPLARAATDAGHEVTFATSREDPAPVRALGVRHVALDEPTEADCERARQEQPHVEFGLLLFGRLKPSVALPGLRSLMASWRPDVVVSEAAEFTAGLLAEQAGIPVVRVHPGITGRGYFETQSAPHLAPVRAGLGLPPDPDARRLLDIPLVTYFPAEFDLPAPGPGPEGAGHARVCRVRNPTASPGPEPRDETVYVTFGTEIVGTPLFPPVLRDAVAAVTRSGRRAVVALGDADPALLADRPDVRVERWVDPNAVLPAVRAVVCHAGAGTTLGALTAATPIVAVPFMADQPLNAERVAATRTGLAVPPGDHLADRLTEALHEILADEPPGCRPMAEAIHDLPSIDRALDLITAQA